MFTHINEVSDPKFDDDIERLYKKKERLHLLASPSEAAA